MSIQNVIEPIKKVHPEFVIMIRAGEFYHCYGKDAYLVSYLCEYKVVDKPPFKVCGFPRQAKNKVIVNLEDKKINYIVLDKRNQYEVEEKEDYKNLNQYKKVYEKARKYVNHKLRIEAIYEYLLQNSKKDSIKEVLNQMEEIINERRKV